MTDLVGHSLGRYQILKQLGEGGMATVYKAYDTVLERDVAVKVIRTDQFAPAILALILKRFEREAKALARLAHPNIVHVNDFGEEKGVPYLVMDYLPGGTLKQSLKGEPMPWREVAKLLLPIAEALAYAHDHNILHRDVKPSNILLTDKGWPMLTDFGIAKILDLEKGQTLTGSGVGIGTPEYMSPEQGLGRVVDARTDIYSLGVVLYELVIGRPPYTADTPMAVVDKHVHDPLPRPSQVLPGLPDEVEKILLKMLAKNPTNRYQDMSELVRALEALLKVPVQTNTANIADMPTVPDSLPNKKNKLWIWIAGGAGIVFLMILLGFLGNAFVATFRPKSTPSPSPSPSASPTPSLGIGSILTREKDGMAMLYIPAEKFEMGSPDGAGIDTEHPQRWVYLDGYWMDQTEVTNAMFQNFVNASGYKTDAEKAGRSWILNVSSKNWEQVNGTDWRHPQGAGSNLSGFEDHPVVHVSWFDARAYCEWVGGRLPTGAEWEKAARGTDGRSYPWGNEMPAGNRLNFADSNLDMDWADKIVDDHYQFTAPVGNYPDGASPYGVFDMAGNVWEWGSDWYDAYPGNQISDSHYGTTYREIRGGAWDVGADGVRSAFRYWGDPMAANASIGFRCAGSPHK
jgi:eukaryotic-like serine/threonine-protein kinase